MNTGVQGLFSIVVVILSILFVWSLLSVVKWDAILKHPSSMKSRMLQIVVAVIIGNGFAAFILDYWGYTVLLRYFTE